MSNYKTETKCIQSGYEPGNGEARVLPIYQSTTFRYTSSEQMGRLFDLEESGYFYTRLQNPTNDAVAAKICDLEGGVAEIQKQYLERRSPIRPSLFWIWKNSQMPHMHMGCRLLWIIHLQHRSIAVRLNGARIL